MSEKSHKQIGPRLFPNLVVPGLDPFTCPERLPINRIVCNDTGSYAIGDVLAKGAVSKIILSGEFIVYVKDAQGDEVEYIHIPYHSVMRWMV